MRIGIYLGTRPYTGGLYQYSEALQVLVLLILRVEIYAYFCHESWIKILANKDIIVCKLPFGRFTQLLSDFLNLFLLPPFLAKFFTRLLSPLHWSLSSDQIDLLVCPAQDCLGYQTITPSIVCIHDVMHRFVNCAETKSIRYLSREHRFKNLCKNSKVIIRESEVGRTQLQDLYGISSSRLAVLEYSPFIFVDHPSTTSRIKSDLNRKFLYIQLSFGSTRITFVLYTL